MQADRFYADLIESFVEKLSMLMVSVNCMTVKGRLGSSHEIIF